MSQQSLFGGQSSKIELSKYVPPPIKKKTVEVKRDGSCKSFYADDGKWKPSTFDKLYKGSEIFSDIQKIRAIDLISRGKLINEAINEI